MVAARKARPRAVSATQIHSRFVTVKPKTRSAITVSRTRPPAITDWTIEIGASDSAATCRPHDAVATMMPIVYQRLLNSASELLTGLRSVTAGDSSAPRYLSRKPTIEVTAVASAKSRPSCTEKLISVRRGYPGAPPATAVRLLRGGVEAGLAGQQDARAL